MRHFQGVVRSTSTSPTVSSRRVVLFLGGGNCCAHTQKCKFHSEKSKKTEVLLSEQTYTCKDKGTEGCTCIEKRPVTSCFYTLLPQYEKYAGLIFYLFPTEWKSLASLRIAKKSGHVSNCFVTCLLLTTDTAL